MQDFEKLGAFYLGKVFDLAGKRLTEELLLYDSKDLITHGVCVGMTGSGKTGLCISVLEEAAIDGIPAIAIDPKGDLGNLLLLFPNLAPTDFRPWIDEAEELHSKVGADLMTIETFQVRPRKSDTIIQTVGVVWTLWRLTGENLLERLY